MTELRQDIRDETLALVRAGVGVGAAATATATATPMTLILITAWLEALETEDLADIQASALASILWQGFETLASASPGTCGVVPLRYADGHGGWASALLIHNPDMPFLVDSIVMAMRHFPVSSRAVLNAVLTVQRDAAGHILHVSRALTGEKALESFVLCLLEEELSGKPQAMLESAIRSVVGDAAAVHHDSYAIHTAMVAVAVLAGKNLGHATSHGDDAMENAAFFEWAVEGGFEAFGYAFYRAIPDSPVLVRDLASRIGVLRDPTHPVYDRCLAGIPGEQGSLASRRSALSVVKADTQSTLHRDQHLDFIGFREKDAEGVLVGEHCFIGLFSRAASLTPLMQLPFVRSRIEQVMKLADVRQEGFRSEKFLEILESLPRTEVFEADVSFLARVCSMVVALYKQPRTRVFARPDIYGRHLNLLVYLPREHYSDALSGRLALKVQALSGASDVRVQTLVADGPLARLYFIASQARLDMELEQPLQAAIEGWSQTFDSLVDNTLAVAQRAPMRRLGRMLPADYLARTAPAIAYRDLCEFLSIKNSARVRVHVGPGPQNTIEIRLISAGSAPSLSRILPALHNAGIAVEREQTYALAADEHACLFVTCLTVDSHSATRLAQSDIAVVAQELFEQLLNDEVEDGRMNALVIEAGLRSREVQLVRAYASYWRQAGCRFSLRYIADCLKRQPRVMRALVQAYLLRFDPYGSVESRASGSARLVALRTDLAHINHADTEDIFKTLTDLMLATLRTSYFQDKQRRDTVIFKLDSSDLMLLPQPRPFRELYVFSRRFEGVHLRGGPVARGGLRWSDRMEDYRTEVLGLLKAQMVKNAVIVPVGAKGGFVCKTLPKDADRERTASEGEAVYRLFVGALLDLTDNRLAGEIVAPQQTVCYDHADPYLVVAADKGTATFSDIANSIALARGYWLGDAFASGGSNGYDHKKLGITAKGAWEAVRRHFFELGHDLTSTPIRVTGVGDMSGDVFGNGLLLSRQVRLIAAFDHRHIFIDPDPDLIRSFAERQRLFALPRSSWGDYDKTLLSPGGGVWPRTARDIALSPQIQSALGTDIGSATPEQLLHLILLAPVDLFYNGGIGTYIKAATESHADVKDRANDGFRVDGRQLRCRVVAEGGNLGVTQAGRIEFALAGGHVFSDAIDNSAGVDCSDHEVNVKIWLDTEVAAGSLSAQQRQLLLISITADIERLVLRDNILQTHLLARENQAQSEAPVRHRYAMLIDQMEAEGVIARNLEQLPETAELARRDAEGCGICAPELAVIIAHVKNRYKHALAALPLSGCDWARSLMMPYFPPALVAVRDPLSHPLANAILATVLANEVINRCGPLMIPMLAARHGVADTDVIVAWAAAWSALHLGPLFDVLDANAMRVPPDISRLQDRRCRALQESVTTAVLSMPATLSAQTAGSTHAGLAELSHLFGANETTPSWLPPVAGPVNAQDNDIPAAFITAGQRIEAIEALSPFLFSALAVVRTPGMPLSMLLQLGVAVREQTGIDLLEQTLMKTVVPAAQQGLCAHALHALRRAQHTLLTRVLHEMVDHPAGAGLLAQAVRVCLARLLPHNFGSAAATLDDAILGAWSISERVQAWGAPASTT